MSYFCKVYLCQGKNINGTGYCTEHMTPLRQAKACVLESDSMIRHIVPNKRVKLIDPIRTPMALKAALLFKLSEGECMFLKMRFAKGLRKLSKTEAA